MALVVFRDSLVRSTGQGPLVRGSRQDRMGGCTNHMPTAFGWNWFKRPDCRDGSFTHQMLVLDALHKQSMLDGSRWHRLHL